MCLTHPCRPCLVLFSIEREENWKSGMSSKYVLLCDAFIFMFIWHMTHSINLFEEMNSRDYPYSWYDILSNLPEHSSRTPNKLDNSFDQFRKVVICFETCKLIACCFVGFSAKWPNNNGQMNMQTNRQMCISCSKLRWTPI